jgi:hypothetical protein
MPALNILPLKDLVTAYGTVTTPFDFFWDQSPWLVISECLDAPALLRSGQFQWMASMRIKIVREFRDEIGEYVLEILS